MNDFSITVAGASYTSNSAQLEKLAKDMFNTASAIDLSFSIPKTELMYWSILKERGSEDTLLVTIGDVIFHSKRKIKWLGYWFTPDLQSIYHYEVRLQKAKIMYGMVRRLASAGKGIILKSARILALGLILPSLTYRAQCWTPIKVNLTKMQHM